MSTVHRTLAGAWQECTEPESCELLFHFSDMTVEAAEAMPLRVLVPLLEIMDPPTSITDGGTKYWFENWDVPEDFVIRRHRDYDLPAEITADGDMSWYRHGEPHRDGGKPSVVYANGGMEWWEEGIEMDQEPEIS